MAHDIRHLGVIMDGNRRWARAHMLQSVMRGHEKGLDTFVDLCDWCVKEGISYLTVYAFSTENWKRSQEEVSSLFALMEDFFKNEIQTCIDRDTRMIIIGDRSRLDEHAQETIRGTEEATAHCKSLTVFVAISYGGRDEILRACRSFAKEVAEGKAVPEDLTEERFDSFLDTAGVPDMDLVIRTGGNHRLSNFFPWQTTYAELYFTDTLWPDFSYEELRAILTDYRKVTINKGK